MNKQTRNFIWSIIVLLICPIGVTLAIIDLHAGHVNALNILTLVFASLGTISAAFRLFESLE